MGTTRFEQIDGDVTVLLKISKPNFAKARFRTETKMISPTAFYFLSLLFFGPSAFTNAKSQAAIPEHLEVYGLREIEKWPTQPSEGQWLYRLSPDGMRPLFAWEEDDQGLQSFFKTIENLVQNPNDGRLAFIGRHWILNGQRPTLFLLYPDGRLTLGVHYADDVTPNSDGPFERALVAHAKQVHHDSIGITRLPFSKSAEISRHFRRATSALYKRLTWNNDKKGLTLIARNTIFTIDLASKAVKVGGAKSYTYEFDDRAVPKWLLKGSDRFKSRLNTFLITSRSSHFGEPIHLLRGNEIFLIDWKRQAEPLFKIKKQKKQMDLFDTRKMKLGSVSGFDLRNRYLYAQFSGRNGGFYSFHSGRYLFIKDRILSNSGDLVAVVDPEHTLVDMAKEVPILAAFHQKEQRLLVMNLNQRQKLDDQPLEHFVVGLSIAPNGETLCLVTQTPDGAPALSNPTRDLLVFDVTQSGLSQPREIQNIQYGSALEKGFVYGSETKLGIYVSNQMIEPLEFDWPKGLTPHIFSRGRTVFPFSPFVW
ncbi:hypothetical protein SCOR_02665 [Sulfidibacter corallicola]|uniref:Uncharacterized protein n=1 Tax=Sulfidibacter corallicola TaxID=2818388 RepID=A0A8A4TGB8_SULCO|nr:hypothetical protein [Sulfidibacter corallicola]QTD48567.1 hypothetical protein J3U87_23550 [Sulfidibacter corallicola]